MTRKPACHPDRKYEAKGLCKTCYRAARYAEHKEEMRAYQRAYHLKNRQERLAYAAAHARTPAARDRNREKSWRQRGIKDMSVERYNELLEEQAGLCFICRKPPNGRSLAVDHNHETGEVRGLLCHPCNTTVVPTIEGAGREAIDRLAGYIWSAGGSHEPLDPR
jgi:hypothetical protein